MDVVASLNAARARFLVIGAYAMAAHGVPRATGDLEGSLGPVRLCYIGRYLRAAVDPA